MPRTWWIYATVPRANVARAVDATYARLTSIVGEDVAEEADAGEALEPASLGVWPDLTAPTKAAVPTADAARVGVKSGASAGDGEDRDDEDGDGEDGDRARIEDAALARLASCVSAVRIDKPSGYDPAMVTALRTLVAELGACVFTSAPGVELVTSESLLARLKDRLDLAKAVKEAGGDDDASDDDAEDDEDDDLEDEDEDEDDEDEDDDEEEEEEDRPSARAEALRQMLAAIAGMPRARRKTTELLAEAPPLVGRFAEHLARVGAQPDAAIAKALGVTEPEVKRARLAFASILDRAER